MTRLRTWLSKLCLLLGTLLFTLNLLGLVIPARERTTPPEGIPIPGRHIRTISVPDARAQFDQLKLQSLPPKQRAEELFKLVSGSFLHLPSYELKPWDNWYLWLRGLVDRSWLTSPQDPDLLWTRGGGFCRQAAIVYAAKGQELGLETRLALLTGHVVAEVNIPGEGWRAVDPDLDIMWEIPVADFGSKISEAEMRKRLVSKGYPEKYAAEITSAMSSQGDNTLAPFPLDPARFAHEIGAKSTKWTVPLLLLLIGWLFHKYAQPTE